MLGRRAPPRCEPRPSFGRPFLLALGLRDRYRFLTPMQHNEASVSGEEQRAPRRFFIACYVRTRRARVPIARSLLALYDQLWSYIVMKQIGIAQLKSRLSEFLRVVQGGESIAVHDRSRAIAHIVPIRERPGLRVRKPAIGSPKPNKVSLPKSSAQKIDVVELLLEERQSHR